MAAKNGKGTDKVSPAKPDQKPTTPIEAAISGVRSAIRYGRTHPKLTLGAVGGAAGFAGFTELAASDAQTVAIAWSLSIVIVWALLGSYAAVRNAGKASWSAAAAGAAVAASIVVWAVAIYPIAKPVFIATVLIGGLWWWWVNKNKRPTFRGMPGPAGTGTARPIPRGTKSHYNSDGTGKRVYNHEYDAWEVANRMSAQDGSEMSVYLCSEPSCGGYHVGHTKPAWKR